MERAEFLYRRTMNYRRSVAGPDDKYTLSALRNIQLEARRPLPSDGDDIAAHLRQRIRAICPEKATYLGTDAINALIGTGMATAHQRAIATDRGIALVVVLMLAFGHGCTDDPLYPWIGRTLSDPAITDPVSRANRLERKALVWLEHVLAHLYRSGTT